jgi:hypothetical protein
LGLALVWAFGLDRWGDPVYTHGSLALFRGEAVRGPYGVYWSAVSVLVLLPLLSSVCVCIKYEECPLAHKDAFRLPACTVFRLDVLTGTC